MGDYKIKQINFIKSSTTIKQMPSADKPEFAFAGRSNVGKSRLINALANRKKLAKISSAPGKTRTINHFLVDNTWYLTDLPGYGFAKRSKTERRMFTKMINEYIQERENLIVLFVLVDSRIPPQKIDIDFINLLGEHQVPFYIIFTKTDKISASQKSALAENMFESLLDTWEELPLHFITSAITKAGCQDILNEIHRLNCSKTVNKFL
ncbi:MAG: ribosome biogenesis GTP-binding protein YihA/YsxC [Bacteroidales bacterium]